MQSLQSVECLSDDGRHPQWKSLAQSAETTGQQAAVKELSYEERKARNKQQSKLQEIHQESEAKIEKMESSKELDTILYQLENASNMTPINEYTRNLMTKPQGGEENVEKDGKNYRTKKQIRSYENEIITSNGLCHCINGMRHRATLKSGIPLSDLDTKVKTGDRLL